MSKPKTGYSMGNMNKEDRKDYAMEITQNVAKGKKNQNNALQKSNYLDDDDVREFHKIVRRKALFSNRTCLDSPEQMAKEIGEYFDLCDEYHTVPVVIGLSSYLGINKSYMYQIANGSSELAPMIKKAIDFIAEMQESAALRNSINSVAWIFSAKNHLGMSDNQTITLKPDTGEAQNRTDTLNALQEVVAQQNQQLLEEKTTIDYEND